MSNPGRGVCAEQYVHRLEPAHASSVVFYLSLRPFFGPPIRQSIRVLTSIQGKPMSILAWIILGLVAGFIGSKIVNKSGEGVFLDIVLGIVGAVVGGWLFSAFGMSGATGLNIYSLLVAIVGAVVVLVIYHALMGRRSL
jgi:uncharacterized membrane protein YeaQ/YmgE (transglycosylase-associated protein family)